jgi:hypothetical protein
MFYIWKHTQVRWAKLVLTEFEMGSTLAVAGATVAKAKPILLYHIPGLDIETPQSL